MVTADVSVRVAWPADSDGISAVQLRVWRERYDDQVDVDAEALAEAWRTSLSRPPEARHRALVALAQDRVVGFALTGPNVDPDADEAADGEMREFTVDPAATRAGHGSRLLQACVDTLAADRFSRAVCWIDSTDDVLREFLTSAGWAADGASRELATESNTESGTEGVTGTVKQVRLHTALA